MDLRPIFWIGASRENLKAFPHRVRSHIGFALYQAQAGLRHRDVKRLKGLGTGVLEIVSRHDGDTYRTVYAVRWKHAVYVLHAFQKKAKRGTTTPKQDIDLICRRLKTAQKHYESIYG